MNVSSKGNFLELLLLTVFFAGCGAGFQAGTDIARGRQAMIMGDNQTALSYFQNAGQADPNYVWGTELREGVLSYLGRAQYLTGDLTGARQTLERSVSQHKADNIARLYLGMTLARQGDRKSGLQQMESGMKGIRDFLNYITSTFASTFGQYWDNNNDIRNSITSNLQIIARGNFDWSAVIANGESIGMKIEREPDFARQQEEQQLDMDRRR
jgi:hypothetical protein